MLAVSRQLNAEKVAAENPSRLLEDAMLQRLSRRRIGRLAADIMLDRRRNICAYRVGRVKDRIGHDAPLASMPIWSIRNLTPGRRLSHGRGPAHHQGTARIALRRIVDLGGRRKGFGSRSAPAPSEIATAAARRAYLCCRSDPQLALFGDRIWSQTLTAVEATSDPDKIKAMFTRAGLAMEIAVDMRRWPQHVSGF
jgi:hypothetical protein